MIVRMEIEVFSDLICPWCFIGKRRLDRALEGPEGEGVTVHWRPFQLYPDLPLEGVDRAAFYKARFGPDADSRKIGERIGGEALDAGIALDFARIEKVPNTLAGHRLVGFFDGDPRQHALMDALFTAYFCEGRDLGDVDVLADIAAAQGADREQVRTRLESDEGVKSVRSQVQGAYNAGLSGVPCFVLAGRFAIPGAQPVETMARFIARAKERLVEEASA
jgi:predicted DsbA family dithiol-disulfide isomerase